MPVGRFHFLGGSIKRVLAAVVMLSIVSAVHAFAKKGSGGKREASSSVHGANAGLEKKILDLEAQRIAAMVKKDLPALETRR